MLVIYGIWYLMGIYYPLVNVYSVRTGKSPFLSSVNHHGYHLFLWAMASTTNNQGVGSEKNMSDWKWPWFLASGDERSGAAVTFRPGCFWLWRGPHRWESMFESQMGLETGDYIQFMAILMSWMVINYVTMFSLGYSRAFSDKTLVWNRMKAHENHWKSTSCKVCWFTNPITIYYRYSIFIYNK